MIVWELNLGDILIHQCMSRRFCMTENGRVSVVNTTTETGTQQLISSVKEQES